MSRKIRAALAALLTVVLIACASEGGGDEPDDGDGGSATTVQSGDDGSNGEPTATTAEEEPPDDGGGSGFGDPGDNMVSFEFGGNWEGSGDWEFLAVSSSFVDGVWFLTFVPDADDPTGATAGLTIQVVDNGVVGYLSEDFVMSASPEQCDIDIDESSADGTAGSFECNDMMGFPTDGSVMDGVDMRGSWRTSS